MRKGEIACCKQFLLFSQCFLPYMALIFSFQMHFKMLSAICFSLDQSKILSSGNGLKLTMMQCTQKNSGLEVKLFTNQLNFRPYKLKEIAGDN